jgi:hypothetical protein
MSIIIYRKGSGDPVKVGPFGFEHSIATGNFFLSKEEAVLAGVITDPGENGMTEDEIRQVAKEKGISQWWTKKPERLLQEMSDADKD